jgi:hypothetical protein
MVATVNQSHFRIRTDATAAQGGTPVWAAAQDVNISLNVSTNCRIRLCISNTGATNSSSVTHELWVSRNSGAYAQASSSTFVNMVDATGGLSANGSAITTGLLTAVGTFDIVGEYVSTGLSSAVSIVAGDCDEFEYGVSIAASASVGDTYDWEMRQVGGGVISGVYSFIPRITVSSGSDVLHPGGCL